MRILFIGDVVGRPGRNALKRWLPRLREEFAVDVTIANGENVAGGLGATAATLRELQQIGVDIITLGNHTWRQKELSRTLDALPSVVRPANYAPGVPGAGSLLHELPDGRNVGVVNLIGRVYMEPAECPFAAAQRELAALRDETPLLVVDFHAEATSEKVAMGWFLDGTCTAVLGTHTHIQTADERVLPRGTAYITDVGMTGPFDSVIGMERDRIVKKFVTGMPVEFRVSTERPGISAVVIDSDDTTGRANWIERIARVDNED